MKKGEKMSDELKAKIGNAQKGYKYPNRKLSETHRANIAKTRKKEWNSGKRTMCKLTPEIIEKIRTKNIGRKTSIEVRRKQSLVRKGRFGGDKHPNWKGGISKEAIEGRRGVEYTLWREAVFTRDNWACIWCGARSSKGNPVILNADHIKPFALFPELRLSIDNGRTLCFPCHLTTDTYGARTKTI